MKPVMPTCQNEKLEKIIPERLTAGKVYRDFDRIINYVEDWIEKQNPRVSSCDGSHVKARIIQRIVEITNAEYAKKTAANADKLASQSSLAPPFFVAGGLEVNSETGIVSVSLKQWFLHIGLFMVTWLHMLLHLVIAIFKRGQEESVPTTILMEAGGGYEECDERFVRFCRLGPIAPLSSAHMVIVRTVNVPNKLTDPSFCYVKHPIPHLVNTRLQRYHRVLLIAQHLLAPIIFLRALWVCPISILLARDIAYVPMVSWLDKKSLIESIVVTTSAFMSQPLWMKGLYGQRFKLHMVWYSQNFMPKVYVGEQIRSSLPSARHMRVDVHWVWTEGFKTYLGSLGQKSQVNVVGPILWYLPDKTIEASSECLKIAVFDITPLPDEAQPFGAIKNYYSVATIQKFITDIVDACKHIEEISGKQILILLKHKRKPKVGHHSSQYLKFIESIENNNPNFKLIDNQVNLFGLLEKCEISISVPYTSTAYIAAKLEKHAIYYDPFSELIPMYEINKFVHFASGQSELAMLLDKHLKNDRRI
ncbi:MAG: polysaccharide biosynthesis PFTS motif protein [Methylotenera sp.]|nr:polysaccharide biosynthesis PFTS motif protein [Methylotenera sp.]